ncbi:MAG: putative molybdenum carrier protein [Planctomycetes bacterium]|nr:putative molybdenum carrier protein [Planctomycetota bacterium]MCB9889119.1 putative molybdenum carrier protein [Planctomycetota bacterium]
MPIEVVSGGQTGVDRAALDVAIELGLPHGGWCPRDRKAEDGAVPARYRLTETSSDDYRVRTRRNVEDSDATLALTWGPPTGGTALTLAVCRESGKPHHAVDLRTASDEELGAAARWLHRGAYGRLNVAGPRESTSPGVGAHAHAFLIRLLTTPDSSSRVREIPSWPSEGSGPQVEGGPSPS